MISWLRQNVRKSYDSFYCRDVGTKKYLGQDSSWCVDTSKLNSHSIVYSGGVGKDISFELDLAKQFGCQVFLFDPSPTGIKTIKNIVPLDDRIKFYEVGLSGQDGILEFNEPDNYSEGSFTIKINKAKKTYNFNCRSISSLMEDFNHKFIDLLKIDIEGFEYEVLTDLLKNKIQVDQICVEFHDFFKEIPRKRTRNIIKWLKKGKFIIIHKRMKDYTFIRN